MECSLVRVDTVVMKMVPPMFNLIFSDPLRFEKSKREALNSSTSCFSFSNLASSLSTVPCVFSCSCTQSASTFVQHSFWSVANEDLISSFIFLRFSPAGSLVRISFSSVGAVLASCFASIVATFANFAEKKNSLGKKEMKGLRGIENVGCQDYVIVVVQVLAHLPPVRDFFLSGRHQLGYAKSSPLLSGIALFLPSFAQRL